MAVAEEQIVIVDEWRGLYGESWKGLICDEAFAHPAKFSRTLIRKIYDHVIAEGWAKSGDRVIDPFGGVALGGMDAMRCGLRWTGCELEQKFAELGVRNIALWNERFSRMPTWGTARLLQGDSRKLSEVLQAADACVSSPPYATGCAHNGGDDPNPRHITGGLYRGVGINAAIASPPYAEGLGHGGAPTRGADRSDDRNLDAMQHGYGQTEGQLGAMREGDHSLAVSSPPYVNSVNSQEHGIDWSKVGPATGNRKRGYTENPDPANLGAMPEGRLSVTSPPFECSTQVNNTPGDITAGPPRWEGGTDSAARVKQDYADYGADNLGNERGETFWSASRLILQQLHQVLTSNAHAVFVVKAFVRDKKIVDFPAQWAQLCEAVGFKLLHDHHALLTEHYGTQRGFDGDKRLSIERKSFFRKLAEAKGSPRIDHENVLCFKKVA